MRKMIFASMLIMCGSTAALAQVTTTPTELGARNSNGNATTMQTTPTTPDNGPPMGTASPTGDAQTSGSATNGTMPDTVTNGTTSDTGTTTPRTGTTMPRTGTTAPRTGTTTPRTSTPRRSGTSTTTSRSGGTTPQR